MFDLEKIPVPDLDDPNFAPFWQGASQGKLVIQKCGDCGTHRWPPRISCRRCQSMKTEWDAVEPRGSLFTYTTVGRATAKGFPDTPYTVGFIELSATHGLVRIVGAVVDVDPKDVSIGMKLVGRFVKAGAEGEMTLIHWTPGE